MNLILLMEEFIIVESQSPDRNRISPFIFTEPEDLGKLLSVALGESNLEHELFELDLR